MASNEEIKNQEGLNKAKKAGLKLSQKEIKQIEKQRKAAKEMSDTYDDMFKGMIKDSKKSSKAVIKDSEKMRKAHDKSFKHSADAYEKRFIRKIEQENKKLVNSIKAGGVGAVTTKQYKAATIEAKKALDIIKKVNKARATGGRTGKAKALFGEIRNAKSSGDFRAIGKSMSGMGSKIPMVSKGMKGLGGAMKGLAGPLSMASKALPGIGLAIQGIVGAFQMVSKLDKYLKELNQTFADMAGPQFSAKEFEKEAGRFNKAIHDGMDLGLTKDEMHAFFKSTNDAGLSLSGLTDKTGDYTSAVETARKVSIELGLDLSTMGHFMTDQMAELNSSLQTVRESFNYIANDAKAAGISSMQFYNAISASTLALGTYGNFVKNASSLLGDFATAGGVGKKTAQDMSKTFMDALSNLDTKKAMALTAKARISDTDLRRKFQDKAADINQKMSTAEGAEYDKLRSELISIKDVLGKSGGDFTLAAASNLKALGPQIISDIFSGIRNVVRSESGGEGADLVVAEMMKEAGIGEEFIRQNARNEAANRGKLDDLKAAMLENPELAKHLKKSRDVLALGVNASEDQKDAFTSGLERLLKGTRKGERILYSISNLAKQSPLTMGEFIGKVIEKGNKASSRAASEDMNRRATDDTDKFGKDTVKDQAKMVELLTPIEKQMQIATEKLKFIASDSDAAKIAAHETYRTANATEGILDYLQGSSAKEIAQINENLETQVTKGAGLVGLERSLKRLGFEDFKKAVEGGGDKVLEKAIKDSGWSRSSIGASVGHGEDSFRGDVGALKASTASRVSDLSKSSVNAESGGLYKSTANALGKLGLGGFASGGVVGGSTLTGDQIPIAVNAGERVLTKPDQSYLTNILKGGAVSGGGGTVTNHISMSVSVDGVSGEEVATAIEKRFKQDKFWGSMGK